MKLYRYYAVGVYFCGEGTNKVKVVKALNENDAVILAVGDDLDEINEELGDITLDELIDYYADGDIVVSYPIVLP